MSECANLSRLDCSRNPLVDVAPLSALSSLRWLSLAETQTSSLQALDSLRSLEVLNATRCALEGSLQAGKFRAIKALLLNGNAIEKVQGLEKCAQLNTLTLSHNRLQGVLGNWAGAAPQLKKLNLAHNALSSLGDVFSKAVEIHELSAGHNQLSEVPPSLAQLPRLEVLDLSFNPIKAKRALKVLEGARALRVLNLRGTLGGDEEGLEGEALRRLPRLRVFNGKKVGEGGRRGEAASGDEEPTDVQPEAKGYRQERGAKKAKSFAGEKGSDLLGPDEAGGPTSTGKSSVSKKKKRDDVVAKPTPIENVDSDADDATAFASAADRKKIQMDSKRTGKVQKRNEPRQRPRRDNENSSSNAQLLLSFCRRGEGY